MQRNYLVAINELVYEIFTISALYFSKKEKSMKKSFLGLLLVTTVLGCGGGGSSSGSNAVVPSESAGGATDNTSDSSNDNSETTSTFEGRVIDGYISGATVCLDINNNFLCDVDEPSAVSGAGGSYEFTFEGTIPAGTQILADIPIGAVDEDLGPIEKPYNMMAPSDNPSVVTPLTTLVSQEVLSSGGELTSAKAEEAVKVSLGFSDTTSLLDNDFVENEEPELQAVAEVVAVALAVTKETLAESDETTDLTAGDITKAALVSAKSSVSALVVNGVSTQTKEEAEETIVTSVSGQVQNIVTATKSGDGEVVDLLEALTTGDTVIVSEGVYGALDENQNGERDDAEKFQFYDYLAVELLYFPEAKAGSLVDLDNDLKIAVLGEEDGEWLRLFENDDYDSYLVDNVWTSEDSDSGGKIEKNCVTFNDFGSPTQSYCFVRKDVSGFAIDDVVPGICENDDGIVVAGCDVNAEMPAESYVYDLTLSVAENEYGGLYELWGGGDWSGYVNDGSDQTVSGFIDEHTDFKTSYVGDNCNVAFRVASYDADLKTGVMQWGDVGDNGCSGNFSFDAVAEGDAEETTFEVVTFGETEILKSRTPLVYRKNNEDDSEPYIIFSAAKNDLGVVGVYQGRFTPSNTKLSIPFTGDTDNGVFASRIAVDFLFQQRGITPFAYELFSEE